MQFDLSKEHPASRIRLPATDEIAYYLVGDRSPLNLEVPTLLRSNTLRVLRVLPKSGLQLVDPIKYQLIHRKRGTTQPVKFGVIHTDNFLEYGAHVLAEPALLHILFWETRNQAAIEAIAKIPGSFFVYPATESIGQALKDGGVPPERLAISPAALMEQITVQICAALKLRREELLKTKTAIRAQADAFHAQFYPRKILPFTPVNVNVEQMNQLLGSFDLDLWDEAPNDFTKRPTALADSFDAVRNLLGSIAAKAGSAAPSNFPAAIVAFPSISPHLRRGLVERLKRVPSDWKETGRDILSARISEQNTATYSNDHIELSGKHMQAAIELGLKELAAYTHFFDLVGHLHASFETAPYMRAPVKGASLANEQSFFAPANFANNAKDKSICKRVYHFGASLAKAVHPALRNSLLQYPGGVVGLSDLPLEWMELDGVPLCFLHDVCRIPETMVTNLLSHFNRNRQSSFEVTANTPKRTLVVCGAPEGDPISTSFTKLSEVQRRHAGEHIWRIERCTTLDQFYGLANEFRPELLVIDSHGRFVANESGTEIQIGNEFLNGNLVIEKLPQVPLVVLSACWGAPMYGCANTIAHAFFETGSFAVTTSLLPLEVHKGGLLYTRLLLNLKYAANHAVHPNWSSFVSHNVRTSYFEDLMGRVREKHGLDPDEMKKAYGTPNLHWKISTMLPEHRAAAYREAHNIVADCFGPDKAGKVKNFLNTKNYIPEFLFYTTLGRADLVKFAIWNTKQKKRGGGTIAVAKVLERMGAEQSDAET
jgi:hypothetical protein